MKYTVGSNRAVSTPGCVKCNIVVHPRTVRKPALRNVRHGGANQRCLLTLTAFLSDKQSSKASDKLRNHAVKSAKMVPQTTALERPKVPGKPRVVVLGSGWGAMSFIRSLPRSISSTYDIILISPRNYFLYTPLLPAVATGTMEERSIVEPVRNLMQDKGQFYEALCVNIEPAKKEVWACFPADAGLQNACFSVEYDVLVLAVGSVNNSFGIRGVNEHCYQFKSIEDAHTLRHRVTECFERAALPQCSEEDRKRLLSFVVAGGGPTGVEVAAELHDMVYEDLAKLYPKIIKDAQVSLIELSDKVLSTYSPKVGEYTAKVFNRAGIKLILNTRVASVEEGVVNVVTKEGITSQIPFGACVWATGIDMHPLMKALQKKLGPSQTHFRSILTDGFLRVNGSNGSIYALGDASTYNPPKALDSLDSMFEEADQNHDGKVSTQDILAVLRVARKKYHHLEQHVHELERKLIMGPLTGKPEDAQLSTKEMDKEGFKELLAKLDLAQRPLPPTAQVAAQEGQYLASLFTSGRITGDESTTMVPPATQPFKYFHKGSLAYVGQDKAVMDVPKLGPVFGETAGLMWKGYETMAQFSNRNRVLVAMDWLRTKVFGRDISNL